MDVAKPSSDIRNVLVKEVMPNRNIRDTFNVNSGNIKTHNVCKCTNLSLGLWNCLTFGPLDIWIFEPLDILTFDLELRDLWTSAPSDWSPLDLLILAKLTDHKNSTVTFSNDYLKRRNLKGAEVKIVKG